MTALVMALGALVAPGSPAAAADANVDIEDYQFRPGTVRIAVGERVTWRNEDDTEHRIQSQDNARDEFDSGDLAQDDEFSRPFDEAGVYRYRCANHDAMNGAVEVEAAAPSTTTTTAPPPTTTTAPPTTTTAPPTTTTTVAPTSTTVPPPTTTTAPPPPTPAAPPTTPELAAAPSTTTTAPAPSTTSTSVPSESTTTSSATSTTATTMAPSTTAPPAPETPHSGPPLSEAVLDLPDPGGRERGRNVVGEASGAVSAEAGPSLWTVLGLLLFAGTAAFGGWTLWVFRPSRT